MTLKDLDKDQLMQLEIQLQHETDDVVTPEQLQKHFGTTIFTEDDFCSLTNESYRVYFDCKNQKYLFFKDHPNWLDFLIYSKDLREYRDNSDNLRSVDAEGSFLNKIITWCGLYGFEMNDLIPLSWKEWESVVDCSAKVYTIFEKKIKEITGNYA